MFNKIIKEVTNSLGKELIDKFENDPKTKIENIEKLESIKNKNKPFYFSKKFWSAIAAVSIPFLNHYFKFNLSVEETGMVLGVIATYIFTQGQIDKNK